MPRAHIALMVMVMVSTASAAVRPLPAGTVQVYGHRGARSFAPENCIPGYEASLRIGVDWVDMDVVLTKDQQVVVSHDPILSPDITRDPSGRYIAPSKEALNRYTPAQLRAYTRSYSARNLTLSQMKAFDVGRLNSASAYARFFPDQRPVDGTRMPTLREVVRYVKRRAGDRARFQIEMKTNPEAPDTTADPSVFAAAVYRVLKSEDIFDAAEIQAFDFKCLYALQALDRRVRTAYLTSRENERGGPADFRTNSVWTGGKLLGPYGNSMPRMVKELGGFAWEPEDAELTAPALREAHQLGLKVVVWSWPEKLGTAFDAGLVGRMIDWGVDGIITDDPGRLVSMLAARGMRVPPRVIAEAP